MEKLTQKEKELLKKIEDLEIELKIKLEYLYDDDIMKVIAYQDYIIEKMPKGFFNEYGEINTNFKLEDSYYYECYLDSYKDILEEEIQNVDEEIYEKEN